MLKSANVAGWFVFFALNLTPGCSDAESSASDAPASRPPPTVDEDPGLEALELSATRVHVRELGNPAGDVIIVLHGGPGDDYRSLLPLAGRAAGVSLADDHLLVYWDQRGTGQSRRHDRDELSLATYARDLADLVDHYSPDAPVSLLGHSWGGTYRSPVHGGAAGWIAGRCSKTTTLAPVCAACVQQGPCRERSQRYPPGEASPARQISKMRVCERRLPRWRQLRAGRQLRAKHCALHRSNITLSLAGKVKSCSSIPSRVVTSPLAGECLDERRGA